MNKVQLSDVAERVLWTAAQTAVAVIAVHVNDLDAMYVPLIAALCSFAKTLIAQRIGDNTAALPLWSQQAVVGATTEVVEVVVSKAKKKAATRDS